jgi:hypothetical protein
MLTAEDHLRAGVNIVSELGGASKDLLRKRCQPKPGSASSSPELSIRTYHAEEWRELGGEGSIVRHDGDGRLEASGWYGERRKAQRSKRPDEMMNREVVARAGDDAWAAREEASQCWGGGGRRVAPCPAWHGCCWTGISSPTTIKQPEVRPGA